MAAKVITHMKSTDGAAGGAGGAEMLIYSVSFVLNLRDSIIELQNLIEAIKHVDSDEQIRLLKEVEILKDALIEKALSIAPHAVDVPENFLCYMSCLSAINNERSYLAEKQDELENLRYLAEIASIDSERTEVGAMQAVEALKKLDFPKKEIERVSDNLEEYNLVLMRLREIFIEEMITES